MLVALGVILTIALYPRTAHEQEQIKSIEIKSEIEQINDTEWFNEKDRLTAIIKYYSEEYKISEKELYETAKCESGFSKEVLEFKQFGDSGKAAGIMQFHEPTFDRFMKESGILDLDYHNNDDQIMLAAWAFSKSYQGHWTCWTKQFKI